MKEESMNLDEQKYDPLSNFKVLLALLFLSAPTAYFLFGETFTVWYFFGLWALLMYIYREKLFSNGCGIKNNEPSTPR